MSFSDIQLDSPPTSRSDGAPESTSDAPRRGVEWQGGLKASWLTKTECCPQSPPPAAHTVPVDQASPPTPGQQCGVPGRRAAQTLLTVVT